MFLPIARSYYERRSVNRAPPPGGSSSSSTAPRTSSPIAPTASCPAPPSSAAEQFDLGAHAGRNIWDLRYPVVDEEYGVVMSVSRFGLSAVTVVFEEGTDLLRARQLISERLTHALGL